jgi:predicted metalloprotease with PDZ domain
MRILTLIALLVFSPQEAPKKRGFFGAQVSAADSALQVDRVVAGSPAEKAGLALGDLILKIDGTAVSTVPAFVKSIQDRGAGGELKLVVSREGKECEMTVKLERHPQDLLEEPDTAPGMMKVRKSFDLAYGDHERHKVNLILRDGQAVPDRDVDPRGRVVVRRGARTRPR